MPPWLIAGLIVLVLVIGALAYYAGRFKREGKEAPVAALELPEPGTPSPDVEGLLPTPGEVPPTVTPSTAVLIEKASTSPPGVLVERSSSVVVPVASDRIPTARPSPFVNQDGSLRSRIVIDTRPTPSPTPTVPELEAAPAPESTPELPAPSVPPPPRPEAPGLPPPPPRPEATPEPEPTPG